MTSAFYVTTAVLLIIIAWLCVYIAMLTREHKQERQDLYNRLMAQNYAQYASYETAKEPQPKQTGSSNFLKQSIDQAYRDQDGPDGP